MRKPAFCICENKDTDELRGNREADQRLCFHYTDTTIPLLSKFNPKFQASSHLLWLYRPVCVGPGRKPRRPVFLQPGSGSSRYHQLGKAVVRNLGRFCRVVSANFWGGSFRPW